MGIGRMGSTRVREQSYYSCKMSDYIIHLLTLGKMREFTFMKLQMGFSFYFIFYTFLSILFYSFLRSLILSAWNFDYFYWFFLFHFPYFYRKQGEEWHLWTSVVFTLYTKSILYVSFALISYFFMNFFCNFYCVLYFVFCFSPCCPFHYIFYLY